MAWDYLECWIGGSRYYESWVWWPGNLIHCTNVTSQGRQIFARSTIPQLYAFVEGSAGDSAPVCLTTTWSERFFECGSRMRNIKFLLFYHQFIIWQIPFMSWLHVKPGENLTSLTSCMWPVSLAIGFDSFSGDQRKSVKSSDPLMSLSTQSEDEDELPDRDW